MDAGTLAFVGLIALLGLNRLVLTIAGYGTWRWLFWLIQLTNLGATICLVLFGLPGMPPGLWVLDWFIALLFMWHIVENNARRTKYLRGVQAEATRDNDRRREIRDRLRQSNQPQDHPPDSKP